MGEQIFLLNSSCRKRVVSHREIWWTAQECPGIKGWECGPDNPEEVEGPSWEGEWGADPSWAVLAIVPQVGEAMMSALGTVLLLPCCCHLFWPAEAGAAGNGTGGVQWEQSCHIVTSSVPGVIPACWAVCSMEKRRGLPLENVQFGATYVQFKLDTSNNGSGLMQFTEDGFIFCWCSLTLSFRLDWLHSRELLHTGMVIVEQWRLLLRLEKTYGK